MPGERSTQGGAEGVREPVQRVANAAVDEELVEFVRGTVHAGQHDGNGQRRAGAFEMARKGQEEEDAQWAAVEMTSASGPNAAVCHASSVRRMRERRSSPASRSAPVCAEAKKMKAHQAATSAQTQTVLTVFACMPSW